jgi:hypothetical protein
MSMNSGSSLRPVCLAILFVAALAGAAQDDADAPIEVHPDHARALTEALRSGDLSPESRAELLELGMSEQTIDRILRMLTERGAVVKRPGTTYISVRVRSPITARETLLYSVVLGLSDAQRNFMQRAHEEFLDRAGSYWREHAREVWDQSAQIASTPPTSFDRAEGIDRLVRMAAHVDRRLAAFEHQFFFDTLIPILAEDQVPRLERARWLRERTVHPMEKVCNPAAKIDMTLLYLALQQSYPELFPGLAPRSEIDRIIDAHERQATVLIHELVAALDRDAVSYARQRAVIAGAGPHDEGAVSELLAARKSATDRLCRLAERIASLNERTIAALREHLSADAARTLDEEFRRRAFPPLYSANDEFRLFRIAFDQISHLDGIDDEVRGRLQAIGRTAIEEMERLNHGMEKQFVEWHAHAAMGFLQGGRHDDDVASITELREQRLTVARHAVEDADALLLNGGFAQWMEITGQLRTVLDGGIPSDWLSHAANRGR